MIGFLTSEMKLSGNLSTRDMLHFFGRLNHLDPDRVARRVAELVDRFDMAEFLDRPIAKLSTGMKQKASISVSIVHDPKVIVFDEPTAGLDILASKIVTDYLLDARKRGRTVLLSTHFMNVAEKLCDRIGFLVEGRLLENGPKEAIIAKYGTETLESAFFSLAKEMINHA
jgi:sodium transport system ATP-binding protein